MSLGPPPCAKRAAISATVKLGDKGDGSSAARAAALRRYAHLNSTHVPDIITLLEPAVLSETKCYNSLKPSGALGHGSSAGGGAPSTNEGHYLAFGCVSELLHWEVFGCEARGAAHVPSTTRRARDASTPTLATTPTRARRATALSCSSRRR